MKPGALAKSSLDSLQNKTVQSRQVALIKPGTAAKSAGEMRATM
jgi:hypothetical protein